MRNDKRTIIQYNFQKLKFVNGSPRNKHFITTNEKIPKNAAYKII